MPRVCTVCSHPEREGIDRALVLGLPYAVIARQHGLSHDAVRDHRRTHFNALLKEARERAHADSLVAQLAELSNRALQIHEAATRRGDLRTGLAGLREMTRIATVQASLGEVADLKERLATLEGQLADSG